MHDLHIHTNLSTCGREDSQLEGYMAEIARRDYTAVGFANHLWDEDVPGVWDWYEPQNLAHVLSLKDELAQYHLPATKVYFGCEVEYKGDGIISLTPEHAKKFDYVLAAANHFNCKGFVCPEDLSDPVEVGKLLVSRFREVCEFDFVFGIVHPFVPLGYEHSAVEVLQSINDEAYGECFSLAASKNRSIEMNFSIYRKTPGAEQLKEYKRMMTIARECGCHFHIGSDAHGLTMFNDNLLEQAIHFLKECRIELADDPVAEFWKQDKSN